jgi:crotonobetainyl-CoA:carnitine CoA-transferase CaiB-like acyl-CoA transferase
VIALNVALAAKYGYVVAKLCDDADVIVENFRPGALAAFGLDYETVSVTNPRVVYASIRGYGQHGPFRSRMAYAPTVQAETGITANTMEHFGQTGSMRSDALSHADVYSGLHAAIAILAALVSRERTGVGQYIDVAMAAVMVSVNERVHVDLSDEDLGDERPILGATDGPFFQGPNGERFASPMSLVGSMSFPFYLAAMRRPDLADDPRFLTPELRLRNLGALHQIVQDWIGTFSDMESLDARWTRPRSPLASCAPSRSSPRAIGRRPGTRYELFPTGRAARSGFPVDHGTSTS